MKDKIQTYIETSTKLAGEWGIPSADIVEIQAETIAHWLKETSPIETELKLYELLDEIEIAEQTLKAEEKYYQRLTEQDMPYWFRSLSGDRVIAKAKRIQKLRARLAFMTNPHKGNQITPEQIARAKEYPWEKLLEVKNGMARCPFHQDKTPSFSVAKGFGHCFSCGISCDQIDFLMRKDGLTFRDAVLALAPFVQQSAAPKTPHFPLQISP